VPLDVVIEFKRDVYQRALQELSRFLTSPPNGGHGERRHSARYLRQPRTSSAGGKPASKVASSEPQLVLAPEK
jgi:putative (di)nucleoside polyphosphate hydrolase